MRLVRTFVVVAALIAAAPATALAQSSLDGYREAGPQIQEEVSQGGPGGGPAGDRGGDAGAGDEGAPSPAPAAAAAGDEGGDLPFTGLDVALVLGAGLVLAGMGFGIRRMIRPGEVA